MTPTREFDRLERSFFNEWTARHPLLASSLGLHEPHDSRIPDGTIDRIEDDTLLLRRTEEQVRHFPTAKLTPARQVDHALFLHLLRAWRYENEVLRPWERVPDGAAVIGDALFQILGRPYAPLRKRMGPILDRLERLPKYLLESRTRLRRPVKTLIEDQLETITRLPAFFHNVKEIGRLHLPPTPFHRLWKMVERLQDAIEDYCNWLVIDVLAECGDELAIDRGVYDGLLESRGIPVGSSRLEHWAADEMGKLNARLREVSRRIRRKMHVEDMRSRIRQQHPSDFDAVLKFVREQVQKARTFTTQSGFATIPEGEQLYVVEMPVYLRHFHPVSRYWPPVRFEEKVEGYLMLSPGDCDSDKLREFSFPTLQGLAARDGYPGHHLRSAASVRGVSSIRLLARSPDTSEGWAQYASDWMGTMGYDGSPASSFMQIVASIHRAVRVLLDVRLATGKMTVRNAVHMLIDEVGMDRVAAEAEVRRHLVTPAEYAPALYGHQKLVELKQWARDRMGTSFDEKFFHNAVIRSGELPASLLAQEMAWRAAEEKAAFANRQKEEAERLKTEKAAKAEAELKRREEEKRRRSAKKSKAPKKSRPAASRKPAARKPVRKR